VPPSRFELSKQVPQELKMISMRSATGTEMYTGKISRRLRSGNSSNALTLTAIRSVVLLAIFSLMFSSVPATLSDDAKRVPQALAEGDQIPSPLRTITVGTLSQLSAAISQAQPGDRIMVKDGVYSTTSAIQVSSKGTATNPVVITAETIGQVVISGSYGFKITGAQNVVIRGFELTHSQDTSDSANRCSNCVNVRFTENTFALTSTSEKKSHWLSIDGTSSDVRVDHNTFQSKRTEGVFLIIVGSNGKMPQNTHVDHNLFRDHSYGGSNGGECVRIGHSSLGPVAANSILEYNTFERCNGDPEVVSVKSSKNTFRYNTFRENDGSLVFRHGSGHIADGNIFVDGPNGIRVYGANHVIINNYFANNPTSGSSIRDPLIIPKGTVLTDASTSNAGYAQAKNILVAHNTFINNKIGIVIGAFSGSYLPDDITVANNILTSSSGKLVTVQSGDVSFSKNILYPTGSATVGNIPSSGYTKADPQLTWSSNGMFRPAATSPAIDAISSSEAYGVTRDIDDELRSGKFDIGADELM